MEGLNLDRERRHAAAAVAASPLQQFAVPHLVIDDLFSEALVGRINENWPTYDEGFIPEVRGNHVFQIYRSSYGKIAEERRAFWKPFNEELWPAVVAAVAVALAEPALEVFGSLYHRHLSLDMPLTLMQADPGYPGHAMHTHFYHCPHWAFTMLLYIDPDDVHSFGTGLHQLLPRGTESGLLTSYQVPDADWRADVAMDTFHWLDPQKRDQRYHDKVTAYKANRLFVFLDGPLALHSVPFDNPDHDTPNAARGEDGGRRARRRIIRSHVKIHHVPFYAKHSELLPEALEPKRYMRLMKPNAELSAEDERYREAVLRPFFRERLRAYARAASRCAEKPGGGRPLWRRFFGSASPSREKFLSQLAERIP